MKATMQYVGTFPNITMTKAQALEIQARQVEHYSFVCPDIAAKVAAITTADELEDGVAYPVAVINKHIPRGGAIEGLCGIRDQGGN